MRAVRNVFPRATNSPSGLKIEERMGVGRRSKMAHDKNSRMRKEEENECNYHTCWTTFAISIWL
jgi:hypothetical protein